MQRNRLRVIGDEGLVEAQLNELELGRAGDGLGGLTVNRIMLKPSRGCLVQEKSCEGMVDRRRGDRKMMKMTMAMSQEAACGRTFLECGWDVTPT